MARPQRLLQALAPLWLLALPAAPAAAAPTAAGEPVVLLHGLARGPASMRRFERALAAAGHPVCNIGYPSRRHDLAQLATEHVLPRIEACFPGHSGPIHFVTHSMGGLVLRQLARDHALPVGRVVMLAPPNHGSEIVDRLGDNALFRHLAGPAAQQLRTGGAVPGDRPPFELGVLAGRRTLNPWLSLLLPGANDGKVTVASTQLPGMRDFRVLPTSHPLILHDREAIALTLNFLAHGCFAGGERPGPCLQDASAGARPGRSREGATPQGSAPACARGRKP